MEENKLEKKYKLVKSTINKIGNSKKGDLYLFVVGINSYKKERNLNYCKAEATEFINIFHKFNDIKKKNIYALFDDNATKNNIILHFEEFQKILNTDDRLIIYIAGHGYNTSYSNFFIPYDGDKGNYTSCITNNFIAKSVMELHSDSILLFFDLNYSKIEFNNYRDKQNIAFFKNLRNEVAHNRGMSSLYDEFISFFLKRSQSRIKESFCFQKEESCLSNEFLVNWNWDYDKKLTELLHEKYIDLLKLINEKKTENVLLALNNILENNDLDLHGRTETLLYKLNEINTKNVRAASIVEEKKSIDKITCEVIERINQNGFYLIKTPKDKYGVNNSKQKIKVLFTSANPRDENFLRLNQEGMYIEYELMKAKYRDNFEFIRIKALDITELQDALLNNPPQFLHFSGHGNCDGIALLDVHDKVKLLKTKPLAELLKLFSDDIGCVFLNSCYSVVQSLEISKYVKKVVCMSKEVPDDVAIHFASAFYKSIGSGKDIDFSFEFAKNSIDLNDIKGSDIPVLLPHN